MADGGVTFQGLFQGAFTLGTNRTEVKTTASYGEKEQARGLPLVWNNHLSRLKVQAQPGAEQSNVSMCKGAPGARFRSKFFAQSGSKIEQDYRNHIF